MIPIADSKKPDWNKIKNEYICGNISQRNLAAKYKISYGTLRGRAESEQWPHLREEYQRKASAEAAQKAACAVADNAVKLEEARKAAIDVAMAGIERLKALQGSRVTTRQKDSKGNPITVDFDLLDMVSALEKLQRMGSGDANAEPVKVILDV